MLGDIPGTVNHPHNIDSIVIDAEQDQVRPMQPRAKSGRKVISGWIGKRALGYDIEAADDLIDE